MELTLTTPEPFGPFLVSCLIVGESVVYSPKTEKSTILRLRIYTMGNFFSLNHFFRVVYTFGKFGWYTKEAGMTAARVRPRQTWLKLYLDELSEDGPLQRDVKVGFKKEAILEMRAYKTGSVNALMADMDRLRGNITIVRRRSTYWCLVWQIINQLDFAAEKSEDLTRPYHKINKPKPDSYWRRIGETQRAFITNTWTSIKEHASLPDRQDLHSSANNDLTSAPVEMRHLKRRTKNDRRLQTESSHGRRWL